MGTYVEAGKYLCDMHDGNAREAVKGQGLEIVTLTQSEITFDQFQAIQKFLDITRALNGAKDGYLNKKLMMVEPNRMAMWLYDSRYLGIALLKEID